MKRAPGRPSKVEVRAALAILIGGMGSIAREDRARIREAREELAGQDPSDVMARAERYRVTV